MITRQQIRAARMLLEWHQSHLAEASGLSVETIKRVEKTGLESMSYGNAEKLREAFERSGIEFIEGGVRLISEARG